MGSLIAVQLPDGRLIEYVTDGKGRRIGKMVNGVFVRQWIWSNQLRIAAPLSYRDKLDVSQGVLV